METLLNSIAERTKAATQRQRNKRMAAGFAITNFNFRFQIPYSCLILAPIL
jgi:hypothetical protein